MKGTYEIVKFKYLGFHQDPYENNKSYFPPEGSPLSKLINFMRLELESFVVPEDRSMKGRVTMEVKQPVTVNSIELDWHNLMAAVDTKGVVKTVSYFLKSVFLRQLNHVNWMLSIRIFYDG